MQRVSLNLMIIISKSKGIMENIFLKLIQVLKGIESKEGGKHSLLQIAAHHRVFPHISAQEKELKNYLSENEFKKIASLSKANKNSAIRRLNELRFLLNLFSANHISFIVLKGIPLSVELYGDIGMRPSKDIDILIKKEDSLKVLHLIKDSHSIDCDFYIKYAHHFAIKNKTNKVCTEIHTRLCDNKHLLAGLDPFDNTRIIQILDLSIPVLSYENNLFFLFVHGARHKYFRLMWLADIYNLCSKKEFDLQELLKLSEQYEVTRIVVSSIITCNEVFGSITNMQLLLENHAKKDRKINQIVRMNICTMNSMLVSGLDRQPLFLEIRRKFSDMKHMLLLKDGVKYKFDIWEKNFFAKHNAVILPLPEKLHFLYFFLHPFLCFYRWFNGRYIRKR